MPVLETIAASKGLMALLAGLGLGYEALQGAGMYGQYAVGKGQIDLQTAMMKAQMEATKTAAEKSEKITEAIMKELRGERSKTRRQAQEEQLLQALLASRQMDIAAMTNMLQATMQAPQLPAPTPPMYAAQMLRGLI